MKQLVEDVAAFHRKIGYVEDDGRRITPATLLRRLAYIDEEAREVHEAMLEAAALSDRGELPLDAPEVAHAVQELIDLTYVIAGTFAELGIDPDELSGSAWVAAGMSFALFALGAVLPVIPYAFTEGLQAVFWSLVLSAGGLFLIGAAITLLTGRNLLYSGLRQVMFGLAAAAVTYAVGSLIGGAVGG